MSETVSGQAAGGATTTERRARLGRRRCESRGAEPHYVLRLYVAGGSTASRRATENVTTFCEQHLKGHYELETIDIYQQPALAQRAAIIAVPTLVRLSPSPARRVIGDLSRAERVLAGLDLLSKPVN